MNRLEELDHLDLLFLGLARELPCFVEGAIHQQPVLQIVGAEDDRILAGGLRLLRLSVEVRDLSKAQKKGDEHCCWSPLSALRWQA